jgi:hypothetical protein
MRHEEADVDTVGKELLNMAWMEMDVQGYLIVFYSKSLDNSIYYIFGSSSE